MKTKFDQWNDWVMKFLKYYSPVMAIAAWASYKGYNTDFLQLSWLSLIFDTLGWICVLWCVLLFYFFALIAFDDRLKNLIVRRIAGIHENDEREVQLTGEISKKTFISMTGILILLLFLSALKITIYKYPPEAAAQGKHGAILVGLGMSLIKGSETNQVDDAGTQKTPQDDPEKIYLVDSKGLPLTGDGALLLVLVLQLGLFSFFSRRTMKTSPT